MPKKLPPLIRKYNSLRAQFEFMISKGLGESAKCRLAGVKMQSLWENFSYAEKREADRQYAA